MHRPPASLGEAVTTRSVLRTWFPLAASWILMGLELPAVGAIMARLPDPKISLAAYGGVVFPLSLVIEAPIIMLLAASTALAKDWASYLLLRRFMTITGAALTALHILVAATPLYDLVVVGWMGAPEEIQGPARIGLLIMTPWTWSIAYRRLQQGVLIRAGKSHLVGIGTVVRLATNLAVLGIGFRIGSLPGIVVGTLAVAAGVVSEAIFAFFCVRPVLRDTIRPAPPVSPPLHLRGFLDFYIPLAMTSLLTLLVPPIAASAVSRMPRAIDSLAVWPVLNGLTFTLRSIGIAYNEVVVAMLDRPNAVRVLRRFARTLGTITSLLLVLVAATPIGILYLGRFSALPDVLVALAQQGLWLAVLLPGLGVLQSWHQGILVHRRRTKAITQAVAVSLLANTLFLLAGIGYGRVPGLYIAILGSTIGQLTQVAYLWVKTHPVLLTMGTEPRAGGEPLPEGRGSPGVETAD